MQQCKNMHLLGGGGEAPQHRLRLLRGRQQGHHAAQEAPQGAVGGGARAAAAALALEQRMNFCHHLQGLACNLLEQLPLARWRCVCGSKLAGWGLLAPRSCSLCRPYAGRSLQGRGGLWLAATL
jgi:hypothetical protein